MTNNFRRVPFWVPYHLPRTLYSELMSSPNRPTTFIHWKFPKRIRFMKKSWRIIMPSILTTCYCWLSNYCRSGRIFGRSIRNDSAIFWWMNIRIPIRLNICWHKYWRPNGEIFVLSVMRIKVFMHGAARIFRILWILCVIIRTERM